MKQAYSKPNKTFAYMEKQEINAIQACLGAVEDKQGWGSAQKWSTREFESLSENVLDATGVRLSVATLKRLFGVVNYNSTPSATTLNALANYLGFENWRVFVQTNEGSQSGNAVQSVNGKRVPRKQMMIWGSPFVILLIGFLGFNFLSNKSVKKEYNPADFDFSSEVMVTQGIPNSVVFEYDASSVDEGTLVCIQQSWDKRLSVRVSAEETIHTSMYYYPGFFYAKLVVNDQIVKEHPIFIKSDGWLSLVEHEKVPVYLDPNVSRQQGGNIAVTMDQVKESNIQMQPEAPWVSIFNVGTLEGVTTKDFVLQTELKNDYNEGSGACQLTDIKLLMQGGALFIPLSAKGCVAQLELYDGEGKKENPSKLGVDFSNWVRVRFEMTNYNGKLYINDEFAYDISYPYGLKNIVGIQYRFQGAGRVNSVFFGTNDGTMIFRDDFESPI